MKLRVAVYVDGFNMYHALDDLHDPRLKWLNLWKLSTKLTKVKSEQVVCVKYFSAFADHFQNTEKEASLRRQRAYVNALESKNVQCIMGNFAKRDWFYKGRNYRARWRRREEKQTDVAIGTHLIADSFLDVFDRALIVSCDADLIPAFKVAKTNAPNKEFLTVAPPKRAHHRDLLNASDGHLSIKVSQVEKCLFGARVTKDRKLIATRPQQYKP